MGSTSDSKNEKAKTAGSHPRARKIEGMGRAWGAWQRVQTDQNGNNAEGNVDGKQPGPWPTREDARRNRRADRKSSRDDQRVVSETLPLQAPRINEADQRRIHAHDTTGTEARSPK
jgi:hypothetical protein